MQPTLLSYMDDQHQLEGCATVVRLEPEARDGLTCLILDATLFYPQGGGQAWDTGLIQGETGIFAVQEVRFVDGFVHHYGQFREGSLAVGAEVSYTIDSTRRRLNSRLHSAGHLLDEAVKNLGLAWTPTKGIHYPGQAAVEYEGAVTDTEAARAALEAESNRLIQQGFSVTAQLVSLAELPQHSDFIPPQLPDNKPIRVVRMGAQKGTPCGGTHVKDIAEIGPMTIRYIKAKKGMIRVAYDIPE